MNRQLRRKNSFNLNFLRHKKQLIARRKPIASYRPKSMSSRFLFTRLITSRIRKSRQFRKLKTPFTRSRVTRRC